MRTLFVSNTFRKDLKRAKKRGLPIVKLQALLDDLMADRLLPARCRVHKLSGAYSELWECHILPDWLLIYDLTETEVRLYRTGSHADLFN